MRKFCKSIGKRKTATYVHFDIFLFQLRNVEVLVETLGGKKEEKQETRKVAGQARAERIT